MQFIYADLNDINQIHYNNILICTIAPIIIIFTVKFGPV